MTITPCVACTARGWLNRSTRWCRIKKAAGGRGHWSSHTLRRCANSKQLADRKRVPTTRFHRQRRPLPSMTRYFPVRGPSCAHWLVLIYSGHPIALRLATILGEVRDVSREPERGRRELEGTPASRGVRSLHATPSRLGGDLPRRPLCAWIWFRRRALIARRGAVAMAYRSPGNSLISACRDHRRRSRRVFHLSRD